VTPARDLAALRLIVGPWRRAEAQSRGGQRLARQLAIYDLTELWRTELVGWGAATDLATATGGFPTEA